MKHKVKITIFAILSFLIIGLSTYNSYGSDNANRVNEINKNVIEKELSIQPIAISMTEGDIATLSVKNINGAEYWWQYSDDGINWYDENHSEAKTATLHVDVQKQYSGRQFRCIISSDNKTEISSIIAILVNDSITRAQYYTLSTELGDSADVVYITMYGTKYHRSNCSYLKKTKIAISLCQALENGYTPCSRCKP